MDTETIDKLYLELAQFTRAEPPRETELLNCIRSIGRAVGCGHTEDADGRAKLVRCVEERLASTVPREVADVMGKALEDAKWHLDPPGNSRLMRQAIDDALAAYRKAVNE